ncbi:hypothetical protein [Brevundimonas sp. G8]|uniref:hypothetical protein n=1 Tax=Brevundimonas sp. G8 TaxID=1350776 RepID=UPI0012F451E7|nr:hypothetical protein [Brevundimonas sp. G8]VXB00759.1 conserved membrane hypothetical protein [Brevundimonas sp. G8]
MTDSPTRPEADDLAYLKRLAIAGRGAPAPFLLLIAVFGGAYGFALLAILVACLIDGVPQPGMPVTGPISNFVGMWAIIGSHLCVFAALAWTAWRTIGPNRVRLSRTAFATWSASFIALVMTVIVFPMFTRNEMSNESVHTAHIVPSVVLILWGCAWWITAITSDRRWLVLVGLGSFAAAAALAWVGVGTFDALPIMCASLIGLAFIPAVILMRQARR